MCIRDSAGTELSELVPLHHVYGKNAAVIRFVPVVTNRSAGYDFASVTEQIKVRPHRALYQKFGGYNTNFVFDILIFVVRNVFAIGVFRFHIRTEHPPTQGG